MLHHRLFLCLILLSSLSCCSTQATSNGVAVSSTTTAVPGAAAASATVSAVSNAFDNTFTRIAAGKLSTSLGNQIKDTAFHTDAAHCHRQFLRTTFGRKKNRGRPQQGSFSYAIRVGLAGGIAGAAGTLALFPVDSAKTLRQSSPSLYKNVRQALGKLVVEDGKWHIGRAYCGVIPATLGAIPSSALYFGAYECVKPWVRQSRLGDPQKASGRFLIHSISAIAGNVLSSALFVPKEVIKQQMQYGGGREVGRVIQDVLQKQGVRGLYSGYSATLLRNIPSAVLRFCVYEELKHIFVLDNDQENKKTGFNWKLFVAGAVAGTLSSGLMTPVDVIKTRMATGTCPVDMPGCVQQVMQEGGITGLYMGAGSRIFWSTAFAAIGFGMLETAKGWLGVSDVVDHDAEKRIPQIREHKMFSRHQRSLEHALSDKYE